MPIRIVVAGARTGNDPQIGVLQREAAQITEKFFNDNGGINGIPIKVIFKDTTDSIDRAEEVFRELVEEDYVVIIGPTYSSQAIIVHPIAQEAGIPVIGPSNTRVGIPQAGDFVFRTSAGVDRFIPFGISEIHRIYPNVQNIVVVYDRDDAFTLSETETFTQTIAENYAPDLTITQSIQIGNPNFSTILGTAMGSSRPDLIFISTLAEDGGAIVKQLREDFKYDGLIMGGNGLNTPGIFTLCKQTCDDVLIPQSYDPELPAPINQRFIESYEEENKTPSQFAAQVFTAVLVTVDALKEVDNQSSIQEMALPELRNELKNKLLSGMKFETPLRELWFDVEDGGELQQDTFVLTQIQMLNEKDGEFIPVR